MAKKFKKFMSQAEFARFRGVSRATVTEYKKKSFLVFNDDGRVDVAASESVLDSSLDPTRGGDRSGRDEKPPANKDGQLLTARINETLTKTAKQALEVEKMAGRLIEKEPTAMAAFTLSRQALESLLTIPDRLATLLAVESDAAVVHEMISKEIRVVANTLADAAVAMFADE
jgi:superfamily II RNA helicase